MQQELLAIFGVCLAGTMGELLLGEQSRNTRTLLRFFLSLCVLLLILTPFLRFLQSEGALLQGEIEISETDIGSYEKIFETAVAEQSAEDLSEGLYTFLQQKHRIARKDCTVQVHLAEDGSLARVRIFLSASAIAQDPDALADELSELLDCEVEVR